MRRGRPLRLSSISGFGVGGDYYVSGFGVSPSVNCFSIETATGNSWDAALSPPALVAMSRACMTMRASASVSVTCLFIGCLLLLAGQVGLGCGDRRNHRLERGGKFGHGDHDFGIQGRGHALDLISRSNLTIGSCG